MLIQKLTLTISVLTYSLGVFLPQTGCNQNKCSVLRDKKLDVYASTPDNLRLQLYQMLGCGLDSVDCRLAGTIAGALVVQRTSRGQDPSITFGEIIDLVNKAKTLPQYQSARDADTPGNHTATGSHTSEGWRSVSYKDLDSARNAAHSGHKTLIVYFTSKFSVSSRQLERKVFDDPEVTRALCSGAVIAYLSVDSDEPGGAANMAREKKFGVEMQPALFLLNEEGNVIDSLIGYQTKSRLLEALNIGPVK